MKLKLRLVTVTLLLMVVPAPVGTAEGNACFEGSLESGSVTLSLDLVVATQSEVVTGSSICGSDPAFTSTAGQCIVPGSLTTGSYCTLVPAGGSTFCKWTRASNIPETAVFAGWDLSSDGHISKDDSPSESVYPAMSEGSVYEFTNPDSSNSRMLILMPTKTGGTGDPSSDTTNVGCGAV